MESDDDLKRSFINRQKRLFNNIYNQLKIANEKGILSNEKLEAFKNSYNEIVYDDAKKAYIEYKLKQINKKKYNDDFFSAEV